MDSPVWEPPRLIVRDKGYRVWSLGPLRVSIGRAGAGCWAWRVWHTTAKPPTLARGVEATTREAIVACRKVLQEHLGVERVELP